HELENAGRIDDVGFDQRDVVAEVMAGVTEQEVLDDEVTNVVLDDHSGGSLCRKVQCALTLGKGLVPELGGEDADKGGVVAEAGHAAAPCLSCEVLHGDG